MLYEYSLCIILAQSMCSISISDLMITWFSSATFHHSFVWFSYAMGVAPDIVLGQCFFYSYQILFLSWHTLYAWLCDPDLYDHYDWELYSVIPGTALCDAHNLSIMRDQDRIAKLWIQDVLLE